MNILKVKTCERCKVALLGTELKDVYVCPMCKTFYDLKDEKK